MLLVCTVMRILELVLPSVEFIGRVAAGCIVLIRLLILLTLVVMLLKMHLLALVSSILRL